MKKFFAILIWVIFLSAFHQNGNIISVSAAEFQSFIDEYGTKQLIDVRTPTEYAEGHIPGAKLINIYDTDFKTKILSLPLNKSFPVLVYCRSGNRSMVAARFLAEKGFRVVNLKNGIKEWIAQNKPIEK